MLIVLATSPRVAPGLLSWPAWQALRSASVVLAPPGHPLLPALDEAGIGYRVAAELGPDSYPPGEMVVWLPEPGADLPVPSGARLIRSSADLPGAHFINLVATMDRLRVECPWDARQTHASLAPHLLEESYEALEALESGGERALREELGDVLMQPVFHARIAAERRDGSGYTIDDVADEIVAKLVRRHPHVFGDVTVSGADEVKQNWDEIKRKEKADLAERAGADAAGAQTRPHPRWTACRSASPPWRWPHSYSAGRCGPGPRRTWRDWTRTRSAAGSGEDIGRELFRLVDKARAQGLDPEMELRAAARRYRELVHAWEHT